MKLAYLALGIALLGAIVLLIGGPGYRLGLWGLDYGLLRAMTWALYLGAIAAVLGVALLLVPTARRGHVGVLVVAVLIGVATALVPIRVRQTAERVPAIHDISTDTQRPPVFVAVLPLRADAPNPPEYAGESVAARQRESYAELETLVTTASAAALFDAALQTARAQGWDVHAAVPEQGRIEATDTTLWYGFKDDVVIRIESDGGNARLDIRSKSRVGGSDLGTNAARIERFLDDLRQNLP